jgi:hypothetical protein
MTPVDRPPVSPSHGDDQRQEREAGRVTRCWLYLTPTAERVDQAEPKRAALFGDLGSLGGSRWLS